VADATATTVWRWDQGEPFGVNAANEDPDGNSVAFDLPLRLPGQYFDKETGIHYNYFRDYDAGLGRYVESDPIGLRGGLNTYTYVDLRPLDQADLSGLKGSKLARSWPFNGNLKPGFEDQDMVCSPPADALNRNPCFQKCCVAHDKCYEDYNCNMTSWLQMPLSIMWLTPCARCNVDVVACMVVRACEGCK